MWFGVPGPRFGSTGSGSARNSWNLKQSNFRHRHHTGTASTYLGNGRARHVHVDAVYRAERIQIPDPHHRRPILALVLYCADPSSGMFVSPMAFLYGVSKTTRVPHKRRRPAKAMVKCGKFTPPPELRAVHPGALGAPSYLAVS